MSCRVFFAIVTVCVAMSAPAKVVVSDNDANIDDIFAYLLLAKSDATLAGIVVTNADCMGYQTMGTTIPKINTFANATSVPFGMTSARGANPFPWFYRSFSASMGQLECLSNVTAKVRAKPSGDELYEAILTKAFQSGEGVTIVATGPLTALAKVLKEHPELEQAIDAVIWEAGAVGSADGNIDPNVVYNYVVGTKAEWNVFWDPDAVDFIFRNTVFPIFLLPVNLTNDLPVSQQLMTVLQQQSDAGYKLSTLAFEAYRLVSNLTNIGDATSYYLWDIAAAVYFLKPEFFAPAQTMYLSVHTEGAEQGALYDDPNGRAIEVVLGFNPNAKGIADFYNFFTRALKH